MSKAVKWQIPFATLGGTQYRIDIYADDFAGTPIQLRAGESPFVTKEDANDEFFSAVRSQTGTIEVCTYMPDGTRLDLNSLLPATNIDRPVRLINLSNSTIEWQGFLSCESYSQNYTAVPENLSLPVISALEALDSVEVTLSEDMAFKTVIGHMAYAMSMLEVQSGMTLFDNIFMSAYCHGAMLTTHFYNNVYFSEDELVNGDNITIEVHSISCKEILEQVARFFGCCIREAGQHIYITAVGKTDMYYFQSFANIKAQYVGGQQVIQHWYTRSKVSADIADLSWRGSDHQRSIYQGARRVKVIATLKDFICRMSLRECPVNSLVENPEARQSTWGEVHCNTNETFYNYAEHKHMKLRFTFPAGMETNPTLAFVENLVSISYDETIFWKDNTLRTFYQEYVTGGAVASTYYWVTSYMAWWRDTAGELKSGLMLCGMPTKLYYGLATFAPNVRLWDTTFSLTDSNWLFRLTNPLYFAASNGYIKIDIETLRWWSKIPDNQVEYIGRPKLTIALQFGSKWAYLNGDTYEWSDTFHTLEFPFELQEDTNGVLHPQSNWTEDMGVDEADGIFIKIPEFMVGGISFYLYHAMDRVYQTPEQPGYSVYSAMFDVFISKIDVDYVPLNVELRTERSENAYLAATGKAFKDEVTVNCDLSSFDGNTKLATMIWQDEDTPLRLITLGGNSVRPELDLLDRCKTQYSEARTHLDLITAPPATALPLLQLNGIDDGKQYLPLAEKRNWQKETSTLLCFEKS